MGADSNPATSAPVAHADFGFSLEEEQEDLVAGSPGTLPTGRCRCAGTATLLRSVTIASTTLTAGALSVLMAAVVLSVLWGLSTDGSDDCTGLPCTSCGVYSGCSWCPAVVDVVNASLPGICRSTSDTDPAHDKCTDTPFKKRCDAEDAVEGRWALCAEGTNQQACSSVSDCEWCNATMACLPTLNMSSFCDRGVSFLSALRPAALTPHSLACAAPDRTQHIDRGGEPGWSTGVGGAGRYVPLAANSTATEGLRCHWVLECPFNLTVQLRFDEVNLRADDTLRVFEGWGSDSMSAQLAYFLGFTGDRSAGFRDQEEQGATSVTGGPSARLLQSAGPVLTVRLKTASTDINAAYSAAHGDVPLFIPGDSRGFALSHRCIPAATSFSAGLGALGCWWIFAIWGIRRAYTLINYGSKSGGLWKMNETELMSIAEAMGLSPDIDGDGAVGKSELIASITQSSNWPGTILNTIRIA